MTHMFHTSDICIYFNRGTFANLMKHLFNNIDFNEQQMKSKKIYTFQGLMNKCLALFNKMPALRDSNSSLYTAPPACFHRPYAAMHAFTAPRNEWQRSIVECSLLMCVQPNVHF